MTCCREGRPLHRPELIASKLSGAPEDVGERDSVGALFFHGGVPTTEFDYPWPAGVPLQIHTMDADEWPEIDVVKELARQIEDAELFLYPGSAHLFADPSLGDYDSAAPSC